MHERTRQCQALLHAARVGAERLVQVVRQLGEGGDLGQQLRNLIGGQAQELSGGEQVLPARGLAVET